MPLRLQQSESGILPLPGLPFLPLPLHLARLQTSTPFSKVIARRTFAAHGSEKVTFEFVCLLLRALLCLSLVKELQEVLYVRNHLVRAHQLLAPLLVLCLAPAALIVCVSGLLRLQFSLVSPIDRRSTRRIGRRYPWGSVYQFFADGGRFQVVT